MAIQRGPKKLTRRALDALETKSKIFDTSIRLFSEHGYEAVTIDDITKDAGVSKGTFYTHFESKDAVLVEQFRKIDDAYREAFEGVDESMPATEQLALLINTMCDYCANVCGVNVMKVVYMNQIAIGEKASILRNRERAFYTQLEKIVEQGMRSGEFTLPLPKEGMVRFYASQAHALLYDWCLYDGQLDLKEEGRRLLSLLPH